MRLDAGPGGIAAGNTFALFDHDLMRFVGAWSGEGFIDWEDILLDDQHNVYPRTMGKRLMANPVGPGWADPLIRINHTILENLVQMAGNSGRCPNPGLTSRGLYRYQDRVVISLYSG